MLETFLANSIKMPVKHHQLGSFSADCLESEGVAAENDVLQFVFDESTSSPSIELVILVQLEKQISLKLQTAFIAGTKVPRQNFSSEPISYW